MLNMDILRTIFQRLVWNLFYGDSSRTIQKQPPEVVCKKKVFLEISQNSQENNCARVSFLIKLKKRLWHRCFPVNFAKFLRTPFHRTRLGDCFSHQCTANSCLLIRINLIEKEKRHYFPLISMYVTWVV